MLTVHHLGRSQSERIVWLCEELGLGYDLKRYDRAPLLAPAEYKALHPIGTAPVITDGELALGESGAIIEYILAKYGKGRLARELGHPEFANYLYWLHFANGSFQALLHRTLVARRLESSAEHPVLANLQARLASALDFMNRRLGEADYFAGGALTLNPKLAHEAIHERIALPMGYSVEQAALGIHRVVNAQMAEGIRLMSINRVGRSTFSFIRSMRLVPPAMNFAALSAAMSCTAVATSLGRV